MTAIEAAEPQVCRRSGNLRVMEMPEGARRRGFNAHYVILPDESPQMKYWMALLAAVCTLAITGCNTMEGAGKDVASGGRAIQDASRKVRAEWHAARDRNEREYDAARRTCAGTSGAEREACMDRAHAEYGTRMKDARATYHRSDMRAESEQDRREDAYDAARERCEAVRGADEDRCVAEVHSRYDR